VKTNRETAFAQTLYSVALAFSIARLIPPGSVAFVHGLAGGIGALGF